MRIGIVTQPLCANYGGILQNYALQQVLKRAGHTPITLDYLPSLSFGRYLLYAGKTLFYALSADKRHSLKPYRHFIKRPADIEPFIKNNIKLTKTIADYSTRILKKYRIDAIMLGSDQVWRYSYNSHYIEDMFLSFAKSYPCLKIVYGGSFGVDYWDYPNQITDNAKSLLKQFKAISVREESGVRLCRDYLGVKAFTVLDPTLLLTAADYEIFCKNPAPDESPYLASYVLDMTDEKAAHIQVVAGDRKLAIKEMTVSDNGLSIEDWLTTIRNAAFVITDSYHGTLFSILFEKQFETIINHERGRDRFITIFNNLGIEPGTCKDYPAIRAKLDLLRSKSLSFLSYALQ